MPSELKFNRWVFAAVYAFLAVQSLAQSETQEFRKVVATGAGVDADGALKNAFKVAVEEAVGTLVDTETIVRENDTIQEKILSASNGFIKSYKVIRQWQQDGLHQCSIEALVEIRELKQRLAAANISTLAVSGANLAARVQTETAGQADTAAMLAKLINDFPNRVLRVQAHGEPVPIASKQEGITRLKIPIIVFVDQKAYTQETAQLITTLDKLALQKVSGTIKLLRANSKYRDDGESLRTPAEYLLPNDQFIGGDTSLEGQSAKEAINALRMEAQQRLGTLPETPGVITLMSGVAATGSSRLSFYAMNKSTLGSLDAAAPCRIVVTVGLADADGAELDSTEHSFEPEDRNRRAIGFVFEKRNKYTNLDGLDVRISPGLESDGDGLQISTSWTGDACADIETAMLPRLKNLKLSVRWITAMHNATPVPTPTPAQVPAEPLTIVPEQGPNISNEGTNVPNQDVESDRGIPVGPSSGQVSRAERVTVESPTDRAAFPGERRPQARQRLLTVEDVRDLTAAEVRYAINEVYARYGATFHQQDVQRQFQQFNWYHPNPKLAFEDIDHSMSEIENENVKVLAKHRTTLSQTQNKP